MEKLIKDLVDSSNTKTVTSTTKNERIEECFKENLNLHSIVVLKDNQPVGLIIREDFYFRLGSRYGHAIFINKGATSIMKANPLIVDAETPITKVSQLAMNRRKKDIYDAIIITEDNKFLGTVSVKDLVEKLTAFKVEEAKNLNPLTNLPGNRFIKEEIKQRISASNNFSFLYIDLDNFKAYNDCYGYQKGDEVINFTANVLKNTAKELGNNNDFVGHIGGDDFVVITHHSKDEVLSREIINKFDQGIKQFFSLKDQKQGYMLVEDKQSNYQRVPLTTLSIAIVSDKNRQISSPIEVSDIAADIKKEAKKSSFSNFLKAKRCMKRLNL